MNDIIQTIAVYALPVIFAITLHEAATAMWRACSAIPRLTRPVASA